MPVLTGPVKPPPTFYYCGDGSTVLRPVAPDALYLLVWLHETLPQDVPVSLAGTEQWVPFLSLEETLFSKQTVKEVTKARADKAAKQIRLAVEAERLRRIQVAEQNRRERQQRIDRIIYRAKVVVAVAIVMILGLMLLAITGHLPDSASSGKSQSESVAASPRNDLGLLRSEVSEPSKNPELRTVYVTPPSAPTPEIRVVFVTPSSTPSPQVVYVTPPPPPALRIVYVTPVPALAASISASPSVRYDAPATSISTGPVWVNAYTDKNGRYVAGHYRSIHDTPEDTPSPTPYVSSGESGSGRVYVSWIHPQRWNLRPRAHTEKVTIAINFPLQYNGNPLYIKHAEENPRAGARPDQSRVGDGEGRQGSHRKFGHAKVARKVILSGQDGVDAKRYQERDVQQVINEAKENAK